MALGESADMFASLLGAHENLQRSERCALGPIVGVNPVAATLLSEMLAQKLSVGRVEQADPLQIPLHLDAAADPARLGAVIGRLHFHTAV
jgi:hypothetical protein